MAEPTAALTFADLITEVAYKLGTADYDTNGPTVPSDASDVGDAKRHVNNGIRMFIADAPRGGWRWTKPTASVTLWPDVAVGTARVSGGTFDSGNNETLITATVASFYETMEQKTITITVNGAFTLKRYASATTFYVTGNASTVASKSFAIASGGSYTLPITFGGEYTGGLTFASGTNQGVIPQWVDESVIRQLRADDASTSGAPYLFAIRVTAANRRRWELLTWWNPNQLYVVQFPYALYFDKLVNLTDVPPASYGHDEAIKAACLAAAEKDTEQTMDGPAMAYYKQSALPASQRLDGRSGPRNLGYFGNPGNGTMGLREWRNDWSQRPNVTISP